MPKISYTSIYSIMNDMSNANIINDLNDKQKEAVLNTEGVSLIIAGAGSGKTKVLASKISYLIKEKNIKAENIIALTFTNKAAKEMKNRIENMIGGNMRTLMIGTFHSCFSKLLHINSKHIGFSENFSIYDVGDSKSLIARIIGNLKLDQNIYIINNIYKKISICKGMLIDNEKYKENDEFINNDIKNGIKEFSNIYDEYEKRCKDSNSMDFDDILLNTYKLLKGNKNVCKKYQENFKYVFVDEFQDTNVVQYEIIKLIADKYKNITVVGDDSQSIYSFRGATVTNILNFKNDYKNCKIFKLEQNYRSTKNIVNIANSLIKHNKNKIEKNIWTDNCDGEKCRVIQAANGIEEAKMIACIIKRKIAEEKCKESDFAILYRMNMQARIFETELKIQGLNYKIFGGMSFYQYEEVKDVIAFLRVIVNTDDVESIKRTINKPRRGIGDTTMAQVYEVMEKKNIKLWDALKMSRILFGLRIAELLQKYVKIIQPLIDELDKKNAYEITASLCEKTGFLKYYKELNTEEGMKQYENVVELLNSIKMFVDDENNTDKGLRAYLQNLPSEVDTGTLVKNNEESGEISLMTIHSAKGLEFKIVFIVGLEEGLFPMLETNRQEEIEEERRLFYVALTRAENELYLSYCVKRYVLGKAKNSKKSRWLNEVDEKFLAKDVIVNREIINSEKEKKGDYANFSSFKYSIVSRKIDEKKKIVFGELRAGARVFHSKYGNGEVVEIDDKCSDILRINFFKFGEKKLVKDFSRIFVFGE